MIRLYVNFPLNSAKEVALEEAQSHYLQKVMRLRVGDRVLLFNGKEGEWLAEIREFKKKQTQLGILSQTAVQSSELDLWMLFSPLKPKRQEFLVEKATELGATCLWPVQCERTSIPRINLEKMSFHSREAAEQCGRLTLPEVKSLTSLRKVLKEWPEERHLLFGDETLTAPSLNEISLDKSKKYAFLVGPEGGFSPQELSLLRLLPDGQGVTLNSHILRAETAALVGLSYLKLCL
ncbi:16S rRNA (uracil(1498)-N(3))-methyltransferase [Kamptonema cortianum]|jgi:16S rRNA (uracil1498-N3)-methyltransferase|nr:16S rRNA (uracil(1498)-N(3))-methyltransferase [Geitlerinema splendidum]MDK3155007.1 16S rRNA (uracil(1498)-N(3))-methyltransferase [Kamptonema cortianum]